MSKKLNGLPHNLIASYFGTARNDGDFFVTRYYDGGYMADWLSNAAQKFKIQKAVLDIKSGTINPPELNLYPLTYNLKDLNIVISKELKENNLPDEFITEAKIEVYFDDINSANRSFTVNSIITDKEGKSYEAENVLITAYENYFNVEEKI